MIFGSRALACDITNEAGYRTLSPFSAILVSMILDTAKLTKKTVVRLPWRDQVFMATIALARNPTAADYIINSLGCPKFEADTALQRVAQAAEKLGLAAGSKFVRAHLENPSEHPMNRKP